MLTGNWSGADSASAVMQDDCNVYVGSKRAGDRQLQGITAFLEQKLTLKCVQERSGETVGAEVPWLQHDVA